MLYQVTDRAPSSLPLVVLCAALIAAGVAGVSGCAGAQKRALKEMEELNRAAISDMRKGRAPEARKQLVEAVRVGTEAGLQEDPLMARTYLALGALYAGPLKDRNRAVANMSKALAINPGVKLGGALATAPARRALATARSDRKSEAARKGEAARRPEPAPAAEPAPERVARAEARPAPPPPEPAAEPAPEPPRKPRRPLRVETEPVVVAASPPPEPAPAAAAGDEPLTCPVPDQAPPDTDMTLRCVVQPGLKPRLSLYYRPSGSELFTEVPMRSSKKGYYRGVVPASAINGKSLQFYIEGRGTPKLASGNAESPNLILVREGAAPVGSGPLGGGGGDADQDDDDDDEPPGVSSADENPLAGVERERERERADLHTRPATRWWAGFGMGSGFGWQPGGQLEFRKDQQVAAGPLGPGLMHIMPEVGYQLSSQLAVSLQARAQFVPTQGSGDPTPGRPANKAFALLVRASYSIGEANTRPFISLCGGGGDGFRLRVPPQRQSGLVRSDTVKGGPLLGGAGLGVIHHFNPHIAWSTELRGLAGFPTTAYMVELGTGIEFAF
jgi:hypothetical protein